jgi:hypothetical protein
MTPNVCVSQVHGWYREGAVRCILPQCRAPRLQKRTELYACVGRFAAICLTSSSFLNFGAFAWTQEVRYSVSRDGSVAAGRDADSRAAITSSCAVRLLRVVKKRCRCASTLFNEWELIYWWDGDRYLRQKDSENFKGPERIFESWRLDRKVVPKRR